MMTPNPLRGEASAKIGAVTIIMAADMDGLIRLSSALGDPPVSELYQKLTGTALLAVATGIRLLTVSGTDAEGKPLKAKAAVDAAFKEFSLGALAELQAAFTTLLGALIAPTSDTTRQDSGNA